VIFVAKSNSNAKPKPVITMREQKGKTVESILGNLEPQQKGVAETLRSIVKKTLPQSEEIVKWGNITYVIKGKNLAWIMLYKDHADFGFFRGTELSSKLLEGTGKSLRHIKIQEIKDVNEAEIARLLKDAAKLES
jgi:hypothetical protein